MLKDEIIKKIIQKRSRKVKKKYNNKKGLDLIGKN